MERYPLGLKWTKEVSLEGNKKLEAAYGIMAEIHTGIRRNGQPEIIHPTIVYNLLYMFGCDDVQKAVGLLHDVREDGKQFTTPQSLYDRLSQRLMEKCSPQTETERIDLKNWAKEVCEGVEQLTNGSYLYEGKRTWQVSHMRMVDDRFKPVKMLDQAATLIFDGIMQAKPDYREHSLQWESEKGFARKGFDVVYACLPKDFKTSDDIYKYYYFYMQVHSCFDNMYRLARGHVEGKDRNKDLVKLQINHFDLPMLVANTASIKWQRPPGVKAENVVHWLHPVFADESPGIALPNKGIVRITMSRKTGNVVGMGVIVSPDHDEDAPANQTANALRQRIEDYDRQRVLTKVPGKALVHERGLETYAGKSMKIRDFTLGPPMPFNVFINLAIESDAIDTPFAVKMSCMKSPALAIIR